jgi:uncharacterized protein
VPGSGRGYRRRKDPGDDHGRGHPGVRARRARRRPREEAAALGRSYAALLSPLLPVREDDLRRGLDLFEHHPELGAFDAVLAAATIASGADAIVSTDQNFGQVADLRHIDPGSTSFGQILGS